MDRSLKAYARVVARGILSIALLMALVFCGVNGAAARSSKAAVPHVAPGFSRTDLAGQRVRLADYRGKVVLLNFWASWCAPCLVEMPRFAAWQQEYGSQGFAVIGVSMDDDAQPAGAAYRRYKLNYPVVMGDAKLGERYGGIYGLPQTFLIDRSGKIRFSHQGEADLQQMQKEIRLLLTEK